MKIGSWYDFCFFFFFFFLLIHGWFIARVKSSLPVKRHRISQAEYLPDNELPWKQGKEVDFKQYNLINRLAVGPW